jgi:hypothetical protein
MRPRRKSESKAHDKFSFEIRGILASKIDLRD